MQIVGTVVLVTKDKKVIIQVSKWQLLKMDAADFFRIGRKYYVIMTAKNRRPAFLDRCRALIGQEAMATYDRICNK